MLRIASDVGGTFTDLAYFEIDEKSGKAQNIKTAKSDTTPVSYTHLTLPTKRIV